MSNSRLSPIPRSFEGLPNKRARLAKPSKHHKEPLAPPPSRVVDPTYGQSCAFPGLDDDGTKGAEQLFYGPAEDGLEYLRMVRMLRPSSPIAQAIDVKYAADKCLSKFSQNSSEARGVPNLLVAPSKSPSTLQASGADASCGPISRDGESSFYEDGTYASICREKFPSDPSSLIAGSQGEDETMPQEMFALSLLRRFDHLRRDLQQALRSTAFSTFMPGSLRSWRDYITSTPPSTHFVGRLEQPQILLALRALEEIFSLPHLSSLPFNTHRHIGAWTISLLAACRDVGDMDSEDVGVVRVLGKSATTELRRLEAFGVSVAGPPSSAEKNSNRAEDGFQLRHHAWDRNTSSPSSTGSRDDSELYPPNHYRNGEEGGWDDMEGVEGEEGDDLKQARQRLLNTITSDNLGSGDDPHDPPGLETPTEQPGLKTLSPLAEPRTGNLEQGANNDSPATGGSKAAAKDQKFLDQQQQPEEKEEGEAEEGEEEEEEEKEEDDKEWKTGGAELSIRALYESTIVLVGRRYGQKDLLESIAPW